MKRLVLILCFLATSAFAQVQYDADGDGKIDSTYLPSTALMVYPGAGVAKSTGSAWDTSYAIGTGAGSIAAGDHTHSGVYEPTDADLTAIAALTCTENQIIKRNGAGAWICAEDGGASSSVATDTIWDAEGDIVVGTGANTAGRMAKGAEGTILRYGGSTLATTTATFASTYAAGSLLGAASANTVAAVTALSLADDAAQLYDSADDSKKILIEVGGLPTSTTAQMSPIEYIHVTVVKPQDMADAVRDKFIFWSNDSGKSFIVTGWKGWAGADDTSLAIKEYDADGASNVATVDAVELATGSGPYTGSDTTISAATIENGHVLSLDFDDTDDPSFVKMTIYGYFAN